MPPVMWLIFLLFTKHFICDFLLQTDYQLKNKGTYGHPGGVLHASLHALGTYLCFWSIIPVFALEVAFVDLILHYHIDWIKMKVNSAFKYSPNLTRFWWLFGLDQYLHALTYIVLVLMVIE